MILSTNLSEILRVLGKSVSLHFPLHTFTLEETNLPEAEKGFSDEASKWSPNKREKNESGCNHSFKRGKIPFTIASGCNLGLKTELKR
jgi:hypothetical protein